MFRRMADHISANGPTTSRADTLTQPQLKTNDSPSGCPVAVEFQCLGAVDSI